MAPASQRETWRAGAASSRAREIGERLARGPAHGGIGVARLEGEQVSLRLGPADVAHDARHARGQRRVASLCDLDERSDGARIADLGERAHRPLDDLGIAVAQPLEQRRDRLGAAAFGEDADGVVAHAGVGRAEVRDAAPRAASRPQRSRARRSSLHLRPPCRTPRAGVGGAAAGRASRWRCSPRARARLPRGASARGRSSIATSTRGARAGEAVRREPYPEHVDASAVRSARRRRGEIRRPAIAARAVASSVAASSPASRSGSASAPSAMLTDADRCRRRRPAGSRAARRAAPRHGRRSRPLRPRRAPPMSASPRAGPPSSPCGSRRGRRRLAAGDAAASGGLCACESAAGAPAGLVTACASLASAAATAALRRRRRLRLRRSPSGVGRRCLAARGDLALRGRLGVIALLALFLSLALLVQLSRGLRGDARLASAGFGGRGADRGDDHRLRGCGRARDDLDRSRLGELRSRRIHLARRSLRPRCLVAARGLALPRFSLLAPFPLARLARLAPVPLLAPGAPCRLLLLREPPPRSGRSLRRPRGPRPAPCRGPRPRSASASTSPQRSTIGSCPAAAASPRASRATSPALSTTPICAP